MQSSVKTGVFVVEELVKFDVALCETDVVLVVADNEATGTFLRSNARRCSRRRNILIRRSRHSTVRTIDRCRCVKFHKNSSLHLLIYRHAKMPRVERARALIVTPFITPMISPRCSFRARAVSPRLYIISTESVHLSPCSEATSHNVRRGANGARAPATLPTISVLQGIKTRSIYF